MKRKELEKALIKKEAGGSFAMEASMIYGLMEIDRNQFQGIRK